MDMTRLSIIPARKKHTQEMENWRYEGVYAFYNRIRYEEDEPGDPEELEESGSFVCIAPDGRIAGSFHYGQDARIPTEERYDYDANYLDFGLGMRPDLCGKGYGEAFVRLGMDHARRCYGDVRLRLSVAAFNERAIKVYERVGFSKVAEVTNSFFRNRFYIMTREEI